MEAKFSPRVREVLNYSREEAIRLGNEYIGIEHLLLGILRNGTGKAISILVKHSINLKELRLLIEKAVQSDAKIEDDKEIPLVRQAEKCLKRTYLEAKVYKSDMINIEHLLLAILRDEDNVATRTIEKYGLNYKIANEDLRSWISNTISNEPKKPQAQAAASSESSAFEDDDKQNYESNTPKKGDNKTKTPVLDNFGRDLTKMASDNKLDPVVGRDKELERISQILSRRKKNNPILIGEPGVGKSAIAEGLALRIVNKQVSRILFNKRVVSLDVASLVAGTKYRGQFEERMKALINELAKNPNIIIFIDEIHTMVGAGGAQGSLDASNMFKPALARGEIQCIGATTLDEYRQNIEKDGALERRFQKIIVEATNEEETIEILNNIKGRYEDHHLVRYTDDAIKACVTLTQRYVSDRFLPDKAIDALDEAGSRVHITHINVPQRILDIETKMEETRKQKLDAIKQQRYEDAANYRDKESKLIKDIDDEKEKWENDSKINREAVTEENVADVVAMMTGIPVQGIANDEGAKLMEMESDLQASVIGQDTAITKITKAIQRNRAGLKDPNKPIGSFIFLGPTGVGKTHLAKTLSKYLFNSDDSLIRIDMSEYMEKFAVSRLVGAPPGYVGYEEGGQLSEKVRRKPYAVILLDEMEKAHPDVFHLLLQVLDDGQLTDSYGRKIDFKNTIIIMTSNIGSRQLKDFGNGVGFNTNTREANKNNNSKKIIENALKKSFAPEFLNRIDDVVMFNHLEKKDIHVIIDIELKSLFARVSKLGYKLKVTAKAKDFISEKGWDPQFGARPLKRAIQKHVEDELAEEIIKSNINEGDEIIIDYNKRNDAIKIKIKKPVKKAK
ncbi:MAG: ATP-dependent Clp protease ATP-binding subunit [Bacteroidetes bacterium]|nr:MAG: ATP-dependent Clp protease ATP-binding subunit [Bacteroidota bacterium]